MASDLKNQGSIGGMDFGSMSPEEREHYQTLFNANVKVGAEDFGKRFGAGDSRRAKWELIYPTIRQTLLAGNTLLQEDIRSGRQLRSETRGRLSRTLGYVTAIEKTLLDPDPETRELLASPDEKSAGRLYEKIRNTREELMEGMYFRDLTEKKFYEDPEEIADFLLHPFDYVYKSGLLPGMTEYRRQKVAAVLQAETEAKAGAKTGPVTQPQSETRAEMSKIQKILTPFQKASYLTQIFALEKELKATDILYNSGSSNYFNLESSLTAVCGNLRIHPNDEISFEGFLEKLKSVEKYARYYLDDKARMEQNFTRQQGERLAAIHKILNVCGHLRAGDGNPIDLRESVAEEALKELSERMMESKDPAKQQRGRSRQTDRSMHERAVKSIMDDLGQTGILRDETALTGNASKLAAAYLKLKSRQ